LQAANCRAVSDTTAATEKYNRLVTDYPDSPWLTVAQVQSELHKWYEVNRPEEVLESVAKLTAESKVNPFSPGSGQKATPPQNKGTSDDSTAWPSEADEAAEEKVVSPQYQPETESRNESVN
jgi:hypothetical protein